MKPHFDSDDVHAVEGVQLQQDRRDMSDMRRSLSLIAVGLSV